MRAAQAAAKVAATVSSAAPRMITAVHAREVASLRAELRAAKAAVAAATAAATAAAAEAPTPSCEPQTPAAMTMAPSRLSFGGASLCTPFPGSALTPFVSPLVEAASQLDNEQAAAMRVYKAGGGYGKMDLSRLDDQFSDKCEYCDNLGGDITHVIWNCPFSQQLRIDQDAELAEVPFSCLSHAVRRGVAPAMRMEAGRSY